MTKAEADYVEQELIRYADQFTEPRNYREFGLALRDDEGNVVGGYSERSRILGDLDGDGADDMLLSGGAEDFGTMRGPWTVHLNCDGDYAAIGELWAHPMAIAIEADQARIHTDPNTHRFARIWVYLKSSGSAGSFGYYRVGRDSADELHSIEIYPGDGGTDLERGIYDAAFKQSPIPFKIQRSTTADDGKVAWAESKR